MNKITLVLLTCFCILQVGFAQVQIGNTLIGDNIGDNFGTAVSINEDGTVIASGAPQLSGNGSGYVRVFEFNNNTFTQIHSDINGLTGAAVLDPERFGSAIDLNADGSRIAIGAPRAGRNGRLSGAVRVFRNRISVNWDAIDSEIVGGTTALAGTSVKLDDSGTRVFYGAPGWQQGSGFTFLRENLISTSGGWMPLISEYLGDRDDNIGRSIDISGSGNVIVVANPKKDNVRAYFVFTASAQIGSDINGEATGDDFGSSVSLSTNGSILAIGASGNDGGGNNSGHVRVYRRNTINNEYEQIGDDIEGTTANELFGRKVSLSGDGTVLAISGAGTNTKGLVRIYKNVNDTWVLFGTTLEGDADNDNFGADIQVSKDGTKLIVGIANGNNTNGRTGMVKVFDITQVANPMLFDNLVAYYPLNTNTVEDAISNTNARLWTSTLDTNGFIDGSHAFDNSDNISTFDFAPASFTINLWFRSNDETKVQRIFHRGGIGGSSSNKFSYSLLYIPGQGLRFNVGDNSGTNDTRIFDSGFSNLDTWQMITCTYNATIKTLKLYVDGNLKGSAIASENYPKTVFVSPFLEFSRYPSADTQTINGNLDEIAVWDRAITDAQAIELYNLQSSLSTEDIKPASALGIALYPNPAKTTINISAQNNVKVNTVTIYDINSRIVQTVNTITSPTVDVTELKAGIYFIQLETDKGTAVSKFVKQ